MRLKTHREDVKDLRLMADAHVQDIAKRYMNLIRYCESDLTFFLDYQKRTRLDAPIEIKRVLKDAE